MLLKPQFLKRLDPFYIRTRTIFQGQFRGDRRSLNRGTGIDFADHRIYEPGDDPRHVDWNIYARLERLFIKLFHTDEGIPILLLIDKSRSMEFGSPSKLRRAKEIAAALSYIALAHGDSVAIYTCAERLLPRLPSTTGRSQFQRVTKTLHGITASGQTQLTESLKQLPTYHRHASLTVIFSDFLDPNGYTDGLKLLAVRGFSLTAIHIIAPEELDPQIGSENNPTSSDWLVEDAETSETKAVAINSETYAQYQNRQATFCNDLQRFCSNHAIGYGQFKTDTSVETFILQELHKSGLIQRRR